MILLAALLPLLVFGALIGMGPLRRLKVELVQKKSAVHDADGKRDRLRRESADQRIALAQQERAVQRALEKYATIKSLAQAISWESMVGPIERILENRLSLNEYVLFMGSRGNSFEPVLRRRLWGLHSTDILPYQGSEPELHKITLARSSLPNVFLRMPIRQGDDTLAVLWAKAPLAPDADPRSLLEETREVAEELTFGFFKARLFRNQDSASRTDGLTGLSRRNAFQEHLDKEIQRATLFHTGFCLMMIDIDYFKRVNDTFGHAAGDQILKDISSLIRQSVYETDFAARYGGEEFALILPNADPEGIKHKAESLRRQTEEKEFLFDGKKIRITLSLGMAHFPRDGRTPAELVSAADRALYSAKNNGRNRWVDVQDI